MAPYIGLYVTAPILVHLMSNDLRLMLVTAVGQIVTNVTIYKSVLVITFSTSNVEIIVEKLVTTNCATVIFLTILFGFLIRAMNHTTKDLAHSNTIAEEALDQQKTFIYSFSHELRNPLNSLLGNIQLVLMTTLPQQTREMIKSS